MFNITTKINALKAKSQKILGVFTKTLSELNGINDDISNEIISLKEQQQKTAADIETLIETRAKNAKIITNIENILK